MKTENLNPESADELVRICAYCKKVWNDQNGWQSVKVGELENAMLTHGICEDCYQTNLLPEFEEMKKKQ